MSNVISSLIFGCRFEYGDARFLRLLYLVEEGLKEDSSLLREVGRGDRGDLCGGSWGKGRPGEAPAKRRKGVEGGKSQAPGVGEPRAPARAAAPGQGRGDVEFRFILLAAGPGEGAEAST